jgi:hypothetical protein
MNEKKQSGEGLELIWLVALRSITTRSLFFFATFDSVQVSGLTPSLIVLHHLFIEERSRKVVAFAMGWQRMKRSLRKFPQFAQTNKILLLTRCTARFARDA